MARQHRDPKLEELISEITVDCYGADEELAGFEYAFDDQAALPCSGTVIGEDVQVVSVAIQDGRLELIATCEHRGRRYQVALLDIKLHADRTTERLFAAYRQWTACR